MSYRISYLLAVLILLLAAGLRLWSFSTLPSGLHDDEITDVRITELVRQGDINSVRVLYDIGGEGREGVYHIIQAASTSIFGNGLIGYHVVALLAGMTTLAVIYVLGLRLYGPLAGIAAMTLLAFGMLPVLLSRTVGRETLVPLLVAAVMLALARALPVYWQARQRTASTTAFAILGGLLGIGLYIHPANLMLVMMAMVFIAYMLLTGQPMSRRRLSYIGFAILVMIILDIPYLLSSLRLPELAATGRVFGDYSGLLRTLANGLIGIVFKGDANPAYNLPGRPLIDLVSGLFVLFGLLTSIRFWRQPRFALPLVAALFLSPAAFLVDNAPNFSAIPVLLPVIALYFGLGISLVTRSFRGRSIWLAYGALLVGLIFNLVWVTVDLFNRWQQLPAVSEAYHSDIAELARYIDQTDEAIPTLVCEPSNANDDRTKLKDSTLLRIMMNNKDAPLRYAECETALIFANGGERIQVIMPNPEMRETMNFYLREWLERGRVVSGPSLPGNSIFELNIAEELANTVGRFTTTAPAGYEGEGESDVAAPPVRFGGNLAFLGYERIEEGVYKPGDTVTVVTYWRVDGVMPPDLKLFTHILADPVTIAAQHDTISISPGQMQARDVFIQVTYLPLPYNLPNGEYSVSIGAFEESSSNRLPVYDGETERGDRLFLYPITVDSSAPNAADG